MTAIDELDDFDDLNDSDDRADVPKPQRDGGARDAASAVAQEAIPSDSAGTPWAGRHFDQNVFSDDDGSAAPALLDALARFRTGQVGEAAVVDALRTSRLLVPLVAHRTDAAVTELGTLVDANAELAIVTVAGPDGRNVLPVFSSVEAMRHWNGSARPVPVDATRVALAAASERTDLVVLDPSSDTEFVLRRPVIWALAQQVDWKPSYLDDDVLAELVRSAEGEASVCAVDVAPGDAEARLAGPEIVVSLNLAPGLGQRELNDLLSRLKERWAASRLLAERVDSLALTVVPSLPREAM